MPQEFEPLVHFPSNPFVAASIYYGVMAYPERGSGQPGGAGAAFAAALFSYAIWARRRSRGLSEVRAAFRDDAFRPPEWRSFSRCMNQGLDRVRRRMTVFQLYQCRQLAAFSRSWGRGYTVAEYAKAFPAWGAILNRDIEGWQKRAALNTTGRGGDDKASKAKDFRRRVIAPSLPVLHLAYGLEMTIPDASKWIGNWGKRDPFTALILNPDEWVFEALSLATKFREIRAILGSHSDLAPDQLIELRTPEIGNEMPPATHMA